jgi:hypothetical protein
MKAGAKPAVKGGCFQAATKRLSNTGECCAAFIVTIAQRNPTLPISP